MIPISSLFSKLTSFNEPSYKIYSIILNNTEIESNLYGLFESLHFLRTTIT